VSTQVAAQGRTPRTPGTGTGTGTGAGAAGSGDTERAALFTSTERAVEVLAGLAGRTHIKEELVHGSSRVAAAAALPTLIALEVPSPPLD